MEKERELNKYPPIFRLTPMSNVALSSLKTEQIRDGYLVHDGRNPLTAFASVSIRHKTSDHFFTVLVMRFVQRLLFLRYFAQKYFHIF